MCIAKYGALAALAFCFTALFSGRACAAYLNLSAFENEAAARASYMEIVPGVSDDAAVRRFVPLQDTRLTGTIVGPLAELRLTQTFGFPKRAHDRPVAALYRFPLPGDAAVRRVAVRFGDVEIETELKERAAAQAEYDRAVAEGRQATLLTREGANVFTLAVAGIRPDEEAVVRVDFVCAARAAEAGWELRFPLTTAPRYVREDETGTDAARGNPLAVAADPGHRFSMELSLTDAWGIASPTHEISVADGDQADIVKLAQDKVVPDRDLVLRWRPDFGGELTGARLYTQRAGEETYFLLVAGEDPRAGGAVVLPREVTLLVDHSGSMNGPKRAAADWATRKFLADLRPDERFNVAFFHNSPFLFSEEMRDATPENVEAAAAFVTGNRTGGGTNLGVALERVLRVPRTQHPDRTKGYERQLLVLTDAQVTDAARVLEVAEREYARGATDRRRISVLCIDAAPNDLLTRRLAERGGGTAAFLTSNPNAEDVTTAVDAVLSRWSAPVADPVTLAVSADNLSIAGGRAPEEIEGRLFADLGTLMRGDCIWVVGRATVWDPRDAADVAFEGETAALAETPVSGDALTALYGARAVQELEFLKGRAGDADTVRTALAALGYDVAPAATSPDAVYQENRTRDAAALIDGLLVAESLKYGVASSRTAFVATRREKGEVVTDTLLVPNALPQGWDEAFIGTGILGGYASSGAAGFNIGAMAGGDPNRYRMSSPQRSSTPPPPSPTPNDLGGGSLSGAPRFEARIGAESDAKTPPPGGPAAPDAASDDRAKPAYDGRVLLEGASREVTLYEARRAGTLRGIDIPADVRAALAPRADALRGVTVRIYADDAATPTATVSLSDLLRIGTARPLNVRCANRLRVAVADSRPDPLQIERLALVLVW